MVDSEVYAIALKNAVNEVRKICPDIRHTFIFSKNGELFVGDEETPEKIIFQVREAFSDILERGEVLGGVESVTFKGKNGVVKLYRVDDQYLIMVANKNADMKYVGSVIRVLIPTVLRLLKIIVPATARGSQKIETKPLEDEKEPAEKQEMEETREESTPEPAPITESQALTAEPKAVQLMVEDLRGMFVPVDTVRIDSETLSEWEKILGKIVESVDIETFNGKTLTCKVKPIRDSKYLGKGVVQMPDKVQEALETRKGDLVKVKPSALN
ncbi:MAG: hypothetical protein RMJ15_07530 [Nitrososphaerota archaeon]|nr:hypothetical protein [Candidatus Bathyarchaeota archaeon]MDW8023567.1 hypothetical protein [Nitrososphaerota archaeon]